MARECGWCHSSARLDWERRVLTGELVAAVAASTPFSESAARRHLRLHVQPALLAELREQTAPIHLADFSDRLVELARRAATVGQYAEQTHNGRLMLQAIREERDVLVTLMSRLGIDSLETAELQLEARALARSIGATIQGGEHPGLSADLADNLDAEGFDQLARSLRRADTEVVMGAKGNAPRNHAQKEMTND